MKYILLGPYETDQFQNCPQTLENVYIDLACVAEQLSMVCRKPVQLLTQRRVAEAGGRVPLCVHSDTLGLHTFEK